MVPKSVSYTLKAPESAHLCLLVSVRRFHSPFWGTGRDHVASLKQGMGSPDWCRDLVGSSGPRRALGVPPQLGGSSGCKERAWALGWATLE